MALASGLGTADSRLSNIALGRPAGHVILPVIGHVIHLAARYSTTLPSNRR